MSLAGVNLCTDIKKVARDFKAIYIDLTNKKPGLKRYAGTKV